ncbi:MAG: hypothetical protein ABI639_03100 [Thermoanaerobaculia bacterium]
MTDDLESSAVRALARARFAEWIELAAAELDERIAAERSGDPRLADEIARLVAADRVISGPLDRLDVVVSRAAVRLFGGDKKG